MKKPRDLDAELDALQRRAKALKGKRISQFGELVIATGADQLEIDVLAGALITAVGATDAGTQDGWRRAGARFFQGQGQRQPAAPVRSRRAGAAPDGGDPASS